MDELEERFRARGALKAKLQILVGNDASLAFFRQRGYEVETACCRSARSSQKAARQATAKASKGEVADVDASVIWDEAYDEHDTGGHIEGSDRASAIVAHLEATGIWPRLTLTTPTPATRRRCGARSQRRVHRLGRGRRCRPRQVARRRHLRLAAKL